MNVGLPGTGIGGVFYLMMAFAMPFHLIWSRVKGKNGKEGIPYSPTEKKQILVALTLATGIVGALWAQIAFVEWIANRVRLAIDQKLVPESLYGFFFKDMALNATSIDGWMILAANVGSLLVVYLCIRVMSLLQR